MASTYSTPSMQDLLEAGVHFGHQTRRGNPRMGEFIFGVRGGVHIINLEESEKKLKEATSYVYELGKSGKVLLFLGTKKQAQPIVKEWAAKLNSPYIIDHWIGGFLTNFDELRKNVSKLNDLKDKKGKGELSKYTKKEQLLISRKLEKFETVWGGVATLEKLPDAIFIVDSASEKTAVAEANRIGLPIVAITDTNADPSKVDYPIPGNDDATKSIKILVDAVGESLEAGIKEGGGVRHQAVVDNKKADPDSVGAEKSASKKEVEKEEEEVVTPILDEVAAVEEMVEKEAVKDSERIV